MDRTRLLLLCAIGVTVLALALGAPSLSDLDQQDSGDDGQGEGSPADVPVEQENDGVIVNESGTTEQNSQGDGLSGIVLFGLLLAALLAVALVFGIGPERVVKGLLVVAVIFVTLGPLLSVIGLSDIPSYIGELTEFVSSGIDEFTGEGTDETSGESDSDGGEGTATSVAVPAGTFLVLLLGVVLGLGLIYRPSSQTDSATDDVVEQVPTDREVTVPDSFERRSVAEGTQTGQVADQTVVYVAWQELTAGMGLEANTPLTPREIEQRAIDAGYDEAMITELTALFRLVRYGDHELTATEENEARDLLEYVRERSETNHSPIREDP
jgi:hypothetical protein